MPPLRRSQAEGAGGKGDGGKGGKQAARFDIARGAKAGKGRPPSGPVNEFGHGPLLGRRDGATGATAAPVGGVWGCKAESKGKASGAGQGKGGKAGGRDGEGYTVVNYRLGQRPRVPAAQSETSTSTNANATTGTRFHVLADNDDDQAARDDDDAEQAAAEQMEEQQANDEGQWHEDGDAPDPLEQAKEHLQRRQKMHRAAKASFGPNSPEAKDALADVEAAQEHDRQVRGPKAWYEQARQLERKADAKIRSRDKHCAELEASDQWYSQKIAQLQEEKQARRSALEEKINKETQEAEDLRAQVEQCRGTDMRDDAGWPMEGGVGGATAEDVSGLARQLAAVQELAQTQASEDIQRLLAQIGARMADIEGRDDEAYDADDGIDVDEGGWGDGNEKGRPTPPWRRTQGPYPQST